MFSESESHSFVSDSLRLHGLYSPWNSPGQNTRVGSFSLLGKRSLLGWVTEPRSPALQADSLPAEPQGKPKNTGVDSLSLLQGIFPTLNGTGVSCRELYKTWLLPLCLTFSLRSQVTWNANHRQSKLVLSSTEEGTGYR